MTILFLNDHAKIERGDIVSFTSDIPFEEYELQSFNFIQKFQAGDTKNLIKRVIALPGDQLQIYDGKGIQWRATRRTLYLG